MDFAEKKKDLGLFKIENKYRIWKPFMEKYNCQRVCEVGVRHGNNFRKMTEHQPEIAIAIDSWLDDGIVSRNDSGNSQEELDNFYTEFLRENLKNSFVTTIRHHSSVAVKVFPDNFFDLIYIDADHTYEACKEDIKIWYEKVKPGGFLLGDDYIRHRLKTGVRFGVIEATNEFAAEKGLELIEVPRRGWGFIKP